MWGFLFARVAVNQHLRTCEAKQYMGFISERLYRAQDLLKVEEGLVAGVGRWGATSKTGLELAARDGKGETFDIDPEPFLCIWPSGDRHLTPANWAHQFLQDPEPLEARLARWWLEPAKGLGVVQIDTRRWTGGALQLAAKPVG